MKMSSKDSWLIHVEFLVVSLSFISSLVLWFFWWFSWIPRRLSIHPSTVIIQPVHAASTIHFVHADVVCLFQREANNFIYVSFDPRLVMSNKVLKEILWLAILLVQNPKKGALIRLNHIFFKKCCRTIYPNDPLLIRIVAGVHSKYLCFNYSQPKPLKDTWYWYTFCSTNLIGIKLQLREVLKIQKVKK